MTLAPPAAPKWWLRPLCWLIGHRWHFDFERYLWQGVIGVGPHAVCRRCGKVVR